MRVVLGEGELMNDDFGFWIFEWEREGGELMNDE
jgi:hypothetical protein